MNLLFYLKKRYTYKNGPITIYLRFTVDGRRAETSTGKSCDPNRWNAQAGRAAGTKEDTRVLNAYLDKLQSKVGISLKVCTRFHSKLCTQLFTIRS
jgi:hypothetical protein